MVVELIVILCICFLTLWFFHREHSSPGCGCSVHTMAASLNERLSFQLQDLISRYSTVASCEGGESVLVYQMVAQLVFEREDALRKGDQDPTLQGYANSVTQHNNQQGATKRVFANGLKGPPTSKGPRFIHLFDEYTGVAGCRNAGDIVWSFENCQIPVQHGLVAMLIGTGDRYIYLEGISDYSAVPRFDSFCSIVFRSAQQALRIGNRGRPGARPQYAAIYQTVMNDFNTTATT